MTDLKTLNKKELEHEFANDFGSPYFPILGEIYLRDKDYMRAEKVCRIGLEHNPDNLNGYYILSKIYLYNNKLTDAEKLLKILIDKNPLHINGLRLIIELQRKLNKSKKYRLGYLNKLLDIFPGDEYIKNEIVNLDKSYFDNKTVKKKKSKEKNIQNAINFNVQPHMATLTFVEILKKQKQYDQALHVLSIIELKSTSNKKTEKLKSEIKNLLIESN